MQAAMNRGSSAPVIKLKPTLGLGSPTTPAASSTASRQRAQQAAGDGPPNQHLTLSVGAKAMVRQAVNPRHEALGRVTGFRDICHHKGGRLVRAVVCLPPDGPQPWSHLRTGRNHSFRSGFLQMS